MSMTQEEIEALMNDTSITETTGDEDISDIDDILEGIDGIVEDDSTVDDVLEEIQNIDESDINETSSIDEVDTTSIEEILESEKITESNINLSEDTTANVEAIIEEKIDKGVLPLPSSNEHKVVNQLNEVAEDTEEKASLIFDALSYILDENDKVLNNLNSSKEFIDSQIELLTQLTNKFPNIQLLNDNLQKANEEKIKNDESINIINDENNKIFEAMEIMQYHDINRQKIERVMSVIKKLADYLNGIFVDDSNKSEVQIAKHISGDSSENIAEDDIDSLISEFSK